MTQNGWILQSKGSEQHSRAGSNYRESIGVSYKWRTNLPNGGKIKRDDIILIRDEKNLLGFSRIEKLSFRKEKNVATLCKNCGKAQVELKKTKRFKYRCKACKAEFDRPKLKTTIEDFATAFYAPGWVSLTEESKSWAVWKKLSVTPKGQNSIQALDLHIFQDLISDLDSSEVAPFLRRGLEINGGHRLSVAKIRIGQGEFRKKLIDQFGFTCAFTGANNNFALEAAHLYSYSQVGKHHEDGGLLLRRDIHSLFDHGLLAIDPETDLIKVAPGLMSISQYYSLHNTKVLVLINSGIRSWLKIHWSQNEHIRKLA